MIKKNSQRGLLERRNKLYKSWSRLIKKKKDNKSIKFDMTKDDIIPDITEIAKNHKGLQQTTISQ